MGEREMIEDQIRHIILPKQTVLVSGQRKQEQTLNRQLNDYQGNWSVIIFAESLGDLSNRVSVVS